jgi:hypothetical protein
LILVTIFSLREGGIMKLLPIGISDFRELIVGGYIYVDKTEYIYKLIIYKRITYGIKKRY